MRLVQINKKNQRGAALVEFALVLPLLTFLLLGIFYFGMLLREHQILQNAAREGARFSSLKQNSGNITAVKAVVTNYLAQERITVNPANVTVDQSYPIDFGGVTGSGTLITVSYSRSLPVGTALFGPVTLRGQSVFRNLY